MCWNFKVGPTSPRACFTPLLLSWVPSLISLRLLALAILGVLPSPRTHLNQPSAPYSRLSSSDPMSVFELLISLRTCKVIDLANQNRSLRCHIPKETFQKMHFCGSSYGHLISIRRRKCLIVDVFTGAEVSPPCLPLAFSRDSDEYIYGTLTAPLASPHCHLLVRTRSSLFDWPVGSDSWSELKTTDARIDQILEFNGQFIAMDYYHRIYTLQLAPHLGLQEIKTKWWDDMTECPYLRPWLVVCGDMLLIVDHYISFSFGAPVTYIPFRLDMSSEPAKWVEVKKLDNWALFVGGDVRSPPFSCLSPERWGGRSNRLYYAHYSQPLSVHGFGNEADAAWDPSTNPGLVYNRYWHLQLHMPSGCTQACSVPMASDRQCATMAFCSSSFF